MYRIACLLNRRIYFLFFLNSSYNYSVDSSGNTFLLTVCLTVTSTPLTSLNTFSTTYCSSTGFLDFDKFRYRLFNSTNSDLLSLYEELFSIKLYILFYTFMLVEVATGAVVTVSLLIFLYTLF